MNQENHHTAPIQESFVEEAHESPGDDTIHSPDSLAYPKVYKQRKMRSPGPGADDNSPRKGKKGK